jgi:hypothetical protein
MEAQTTQVSLAQQIEDKVPQVEEQRDHQTETVLRAVLVLLSFPSNHSVDGVFAALTLWSPDNEPE